MTRTAFLVGALLVSSACARNRAPPLPTFAAAPATLTIDEASPWEEVEMASEDTAAGEAPSPAPVPVRVAPIVPRRPVTASPPVVPPTRRVTPAPRPLGAPPTKSPGALARERHLDHPTRIRGDRITFYCPPPYAREVRLTGDEVRETRPGRRMATGNARLLCRELTLEANRIVLRIRDDGSEDIQVTARGDVEFVTDQRGQTLSESGLRSLILTNDQVVPLR
ncbi:MAG: hypothetical protein ACYTG6_17295 [Planctomycetota bacterium]|jgi:hypothetical protein